MKTSIKSVLVSCVLSSVLVACGGGGGGDNVNSSGSTDTGSTNTGSTNKVITTSCSSPDGGKTYLISTDGCLVKTSSNTQSGVCTSATTIKLLTGTDLTKEKVIAQGSSFSSGNGLSINGVSYKCI